MLTGKSPPEVCNKLQCPGIFLRRGRDSSRALTQAQLNPYVPLNKTVCGFEEAAVLVKRGSSIPIPSLGFKSHSQQRW